jgi:hypothetical protein
MVQSWNPAQTTTHLTLSNTNLTTTGNANFYNCAFALESVTTGKFYWEITLTTITGSSPTVGIGNTASAYDFEYLGDKANTMGWSSANGGTPGGVVSNLTLIATWAAYTVASGAVTLCLALDLINNKLWGRIGAAGNWNNDVIANQNPATNTGGAAIPSAVYANPVVPGISTLQINDVAVGNFSVGSWIGAAPSGFGPFDVVAWPRAVVSYFRR